MVCSFQHFQLLSGAIFPLQKHVFFRWDALVVAQLPQPVCEKTCRLRIAFGKETFVAAIVDVHCVTSGVWRRQMQTNGWWRAILVASK
jgi:hypothetical protein